MSSQLNHLQSMFLRSNFSIRSIAAKENEEKVLFVELVLNMETTRSHALAPLRNAIVNGKLGEFKVADYLDTCEGLMTYLFLYLNDFISIFNS